MAEPSTNAGAPAPGAMKSDWPRALRALGRLLADKNDTVQVFEIMRALNGAAAARGYLRLLRTPEGGRLAYERLEFSSRLMDETWLDSLPAGSVGAAYRAFVRAEQISAHALAEVSQQGLTQLNDPHPYAWFGRRTRDIHDIWHVLTGYGRDALGEACLVAFSYAQTRGPGWALIAVGAALRRRPRGHPYRRAIWEGYRRGRAARWLQGEDYERLMAEPLEAARRRLGLASARVYQAVPPELRDVVGRRTTI